MSTPTAVVDAQLQHLLDVVEREREKRCHGMIEAAEQQAGEIVRQAYRDARTRAHQDLEELREQIRQRIASAEAQEQTRLRHLRQQADQAFLDAAWQPLQQALLKHWQHGEHRTQWISHLVDTAASMLMDRHWLIEHPPDWPADEGNALQDKLRREIDCIPRLEPQAGITAGLRISAGGACVDASIEGLLRQRTRIEALLLAEIGKQHATPA